MRVFQMYNGQNQEEEQRIFTSDDEEDIIDTVPQGRNQEEELAFSQSMKDLMSLYSKFSKRGGGNNESKESSRPLF